MNTAMNTATHVFEQPLTEVPDIPLQFGQDGGKFYHYYDQLADELDEDLTKRLKAQLDSLLIFAGLFAGVNSAFLALTLPMMSADPANDTNALLLQLVKGGNTTINPEADLPSASFSPPSAIYPVNVLFAVSLTCALMSSFLAVLGQQWLVYYRKRSGGGAEHQRNEQLRRQLGAQRWGLELVLDDILPSLLQVGLVVFCIAFVLYLHTLSGAMSTVVAALVGTALAITFGAAVCATWDRMCPYQSPLSHLLCWTVDHMKPLVVGFVWGFICLKTYFDEILGSGPQERDTVNIGRHRQPPEDLKTRSWKSAQEITSHGLTRLSRKVETTNDLKLALLKRVMLTSEHTTALIYAATNLCAMDDQQSLLQLLNDAEFIDRLHDLFLTFRVALNALPTQLRTMSDVAVKAFAAAILHMALSVGTTTDLVPPGYRHQTIEGFPHPRELPREAEWHVYRIALNAGFKLTFFVGDLKHVSDLRLVGGLIQSFIRCQDRESMQYKLLCQAHAVARCTTSYQLLHTLALAVRMVRECHERPSEEIPIGVLFYQLFELAKATYQGRKDVRKVPFLSEALRPSSKSWDDAKFTRPESYELCMDVLRHASGLKDLYLDDVFAAAGVLLQALEVDIRLASTPPRYREQLRAHRDQSIGLIMLLFERDMVYWQLSPLLKSLTETLKLIRKSAAAQEPGHPENGVTLDRFRRLLVGVPVKFDIGGTENTEDIDALERECHRFETWINMGGCAKSAGRLNRDPELGWCPYVEGQPLYLQRKWECLTGQDLDCSMDLYN